MTLKVTKVGRRVAGSGLLAESAHFLLEYLQNNGRGIMERMPLEDDNEANINAKVNEYLPFLLFELVLNSPEYEPILGKYATRRIPYQLLESAVSARAEFLAPDLYTKPWQRNPGAINAADIAVEWINGRSLRDIEGRFRDLRGGQVRGLFSDLSQILYGFAEILSAATDPTASSVDKAEFSLSSDLLAESARRLIGVIRRLALRLERGLPDEALWLADLSVRRGNGNLRRVLTNAQVVAIHSARLATSECILDGGRTADLIVALRPHHNNVNQLIQSLRESVSIWRRDEMKNLLDRQKRRLPVECHQIIDSYYSATGTHFEEILAEAFECVHVEIDDRDRHGLNAFPDFVLSITSPSDVTIECKSKQGDGSVSFNDATEILRKSDVNGFDKSHRITVCQPFVSTDVPRKISNCKKLTIVEASDLAEALVRLYTGKLDMDGFKNWITEPGHVKLTSIPPKSVLQVEARPVVQSVT